MCHPSCSPFVSFVARRQSSRSRTRVRTQYHRPSLLRQHQLRRSVRLLLCLAKASIGHLHPEHLSSQLTPKRTEAIAASVPARRDRRCGQGGIRGDDGRVIRGGAPRAQARGILVCVYAHQTTAGWSTLIEAVRRAGFVVVEAWPLDTEMPTRGRTGNGVARVVDLPRRPPARGRRNG